MDEEEEARPSIHNRTSIVRREPKERERTEEEAPRKFVAKEGGRCAFEFHSLISLLLPFQCNHMLFDFVSLYW